MTFLFSFLSWTNWLETRLYSLYYLSLAHFLMTDLISTGDISSRICTAAEIKYYFQSFTNIGTPQHSTYLKPNLNCNLTYWGAGCEPGWGCSLNLNLNQKVDLKAVRIPARTSDCQPCCEGFFCPEGITCMMRKYGLTATLSLLIEMQSIMWFT